MERQTTIKKLFFDEGVQFAIPSYQRAYSWEVEKDKKQVKQFITDIQEQNPKKKYFLGHFLFEKDKITENKFWVIDGQQRLTTVIIFFSVLINELEKRKEKAEKNKIIDEDGEEIDIWRISENYIKYRKIYKFETVVYDNPFFESYILTNDENVSTDTSSGKRIKKTKTIFKKTIEKATLTELLNWKNIIDNSVVTTFEVSDKIQATQIFAFQNDRGKSLSTLEKLKAFLMHKIYSVTENENPESLIRNIETLFADIYKQTERISYNEDQVLNFHNFSFLKGWETTIDNVKAELKNTADKETWIKKFVNNLKETFLTIEYIEKISEQDSSISDILILDNYHSIPILLKLFHFHKDDLSLIQKSASLVELILFRLEYKNADYRTNKLHSIAKAYKGDNLRLQEELNVIINEGFKSYWNFNGNCKNYFINNKYHYHKNIKYVLWKYENSLRQENRTRTISPIEFINKFGAKNLENTTDHITPRNPNFIAYSDDFKIDWLNNIGNLTLMVWGDNSAKRNNNPVDKIDLFDSDYYSHKEIRKTLNNEKKWTEIEIKNRRDRIVKFINRKWKLE